MRSGGLRVPPPAPQNGGNTSSERRDAAYEAKRQAIGNAFDAAVATAFTLQVVEPHLNGPGGDVPVIVHDIRKGRVEVICGQGPAPAGATIAQ